MPKNLRVVATTPGPSTPSEVVESIDQTMIAILGELGSQAIDRAAQSTEAIFKISSNYVAKPAFDALEGFYKLYFSKQDSIDHQKVEVDALFEAAARAM